MIDPSVQQSMIGGGLHIRSKPSPEQNNYPTSKKTRADVNAGMVFRDLEHCCTSTYFPVIASPFEKGLVLWHPWLPPNVYSFTVIATKVVTEFSKRLHMEDQTLPCQSAFLCHIGLGRVQERFDKALQGTPSTDNGLEASTSRLSLIHI